MQKSSFIIGLLNSEDKNIAEYLATWDDLKCRSVFPDLELFKTVCMLALFLFVNRALDFGLARAWGIFETCIGPSGLMSAHIRQYGAMRVR